MFPMTIHPSKRAFIASASLYSFKNIGNLENELLPCPSLVRRPLDLNVRIHPNELHKNVLVHGGAIGTSPINGFARCWHTDLA